MAGSSLSRTTFRFFWLWKWRKQGCHGQQLRLVWQHQLHWLPPWYRKILHCQLHDEQGVCEKTDWNRVSYTEFAYQIMQGYVSSSLTKTTTLPFKSVVLTSGEIWQLVPNCFVVRLTRLATLSLFHWSQMQLVRNLVNQKKRSLAQSWKRLPHTKCTNSGWTLWTLTLFASWKSLLSRHLMRLKISKQFEAAPHERLAQKFCSWSRNTCSRAKKLTKKPSTSPNISSCRNIKKPSVKELKQGLRGYQTTKYKQTKPQYRGTPAHLVVNSKRQAREDVQNGAYLRQRWPHSRPWLCPEWRW